MSANCDANVLDANNTQPTNVSTSSFVTALVLNAGLFIAQILIFTFMRQVNKIIYSPKTIVPQEPEKRIEPLPKGLVSWVPAIITIPDKEIIRVTGLDAYMFVRYLKFFGILNVIYFALTWPILLPIDAVNSGNGSGFDMFTFGNVIDPTRYWAHLVLAWVLVGITLALIWKEMAKYVALRHVFLRRPDFRDTPAAKTILVTNIPSNFLSVSALEKVFGAFSGGIKQIWINRDIHDLPDLVKERDDAVYGLESAETSWIKLNNKTLAKAEKMASKGKDNEKAAIAEAGEIVPAKKRPTHKVKKGPLPAFLYGRKVDSLDFYKSEIVRLNKEIFEKRKLLGEYTAYGSAFIQFNQQIAAHMAVQSLAHHTPNAMNPRYMGAHPDDIVWSNLDVNWLFRRIWQVIILAFTVALVIFWAIPVAAVGFISSLTTLQCKIPALQVLNSMPVVAGIIQGILPPAALAILMALLPIILRLATRMQGIPTWTAIDLSLMNKYYFFLVVNVFLIVGVASSITKVIQPLLQNPGNAVNFLAQNIPKSSSFFINYIMLQGFIVSASEILRVAPLALYYILGKLFDNTPRKVWNRGHNMSVPSWGTLFPQFTLITTIGLSYAIIAPIVVGFTMLSFGLFYFVYRNQFLYVYDCPKHTETGGRYFPRALYQTLTGVYLMEIVLIGLFFLASNPDKTRAAFPQAILMIILLGLTAGFQILLQLTFDPLVEALPIDLAHKDFGTDIRAELVDNGEDIEESKVQNEHKRNESNVSQVSAFDRMPSVNWYMHPSAYSPQPVVWLPNDSEGANIEPKELNNITEKDIAASDEGAIMTKDGVIIVTEPPPELDMQPIHEIIDKEALAKTKESLLKKIPVPHIPSISLHHGQSKEFKETQESEETKDLQDINLDDSEHSLVRTE